MNRRWRAAGRAAASLLLALLATAGPAEAAAVRALSDGRLLASADPVQRGAGLRVATSVGAKVARIPIAWSTVVDQSLEGPPPGPVPLSDPAHPAYDWSRIDASLRDIAAAGLTPLAYFATVPPWAQSAPRYRYAWVGTWAPRPAALADFASAVARRYDGTYPDPLNAGGHLPRVRDFQTWNEPNLARYLQPQWIASNSGRAHLFSPGWYRRMHLAAYRAIHARQPTATVGLAGLAPTGDHTEGGARVEPLRFLRALLCLDGSPPRADCDEPLPFDAIALHPLSTTDPDRPAQRADDIAVADLQPKLTTLLDRALRAGRIDRAARRAPLWVTELNWTSADAGGVPAVRQPEVIGRAMLRLEQAGATLVGWQFATDPPLDRTLGLQRPAGLTAPLAGDPRQLPGRPKRFLGAFRFPVAAVAIGRRSAYVWTQLRPERPGIEADERRVTLEWRRPGRGGTWTSAGRLPIRDGGAATAGLTARGVVAVPTGARLRVRVAGPIGSRLPVRVSDEIRAVTRLGRVRADAGESAVRTQVRTTPAPPDARPADPAGPGSFPTIPPVMAGGAPPAPNGRLLIPRAVVEPPASTLRFNGSAGRDVLLGTPGDDVLVGLGGDDLLIGLGGDDRFVPGPGRDRVVRR